MLVLTLLLLLLPWWRDDQGSLQAPGQGTERLGSVLQRRGGGKDEGCKGLCMWC